VGNSYIVLYDDVILDVDRLPRCLRICGMMILSS
jgi:hypothetical protein